MSVVVQLCVAFAYVVAFVYRVVVCSPKKSMSLCLGVSRCVAKKKVAENNGSPRKKYAIIRA